MSAYDRRPRSFLGALSLLLGVALAMPAVSSAQLTTDRPGFGVAAPTVSDASFQAEFGYAFNGNGITSQELGQVLLRYGVNERLELRGGVNSYVINESPVDNGYTGTSVGAKYELLNSQTSRLSGVASLALPNGTGPFDTADDRARQQLALAFDGMLGENLTLSVNGGASFFYSAGQQNDRFLQWLLIPTLSVGVTESTNAYVGYAGFYNEFRNQNWVEGGLTVLSNPDTQFDVNTGLRLDERSDAFFIGFGVSHRF